MNAIQTLEDAYLLIEDDKITGFGKWTPEAAADIRSSTSGLREMDAEGGYVFPAWCDAHTHLVYAGSREREFVDRINGLTYQQIFERGGGILNSAERLRKASEEELIESAHERLTEMMRMGTGAVEIKSGYGLDKQSELKMLRVIRKLSDVSAVTIRSTFLGAHAVPADYKNDKSGYIRLLTERIMPQIADEGLADYCDVFCEDGYFTSDETKHILETGKKFGMIPKVHAEQLSHSGGIAAGVATGAVSVDHLEFANDEDIRLLKNSGTMPVLLPAAQLFLGLQNPPVRKMISEGLPVALCTDFNPGSSPTGNMNMVVSLGCILYKMTPSEAIIAATTNSAYAMGLSGSHGSIALGKTANVFITRPLPSMDYLPYYFGQTLVETVILNGNIEYHHLH